jgi:Ca-activated chloride channel family protein
MTQRLTLAVLIFLLAFSAVPADVDRPDRTWNTEMSGTPTDSGGARAALRLVRASYEVDVLGSLAVGELIQEFVNDSGVNVSATYVGQPPGLAIVKLEAEVGGQTQDIRAEDRSSEAKSRKAASTRAKRQRRSVQQQAQPSQAVEVEAGKSVIVRATFRATLPIDEGRFLLRLPGVGGQPSDTPAEEGTPPLGPMGAITVSVHHEEPLPYAESRTHDVIAGYEGDRTVFELAEGESESREFELEFAHGVEDDATLLGNVTSSDDGTHEVIAVLAPPMEPPDDTVRPKQVLFVLDTSGSMGKGKLDLARTALSSCLEELSPVDQFNIAGFNNEFRMLGEEPLSAEGSAPQNATGWLAGLRPSGGTQLLPALTATFEQPESDEHHRMIVLLTDGALQDRREVLELLELGLGEGRMFVIGIGEDVSRDTIERIAQFGRGMAVFADDPEDLDAVMSAMFASVSAPLAWDLRLDLGGAEIESMEPARLPDLYAGRPVTLRVRVRGELPEQLLVEASTTSGMRQFTTTLAPAGSERLSGLGRR